MFLLQYCRTFCGCPDEDHKEFFPDGEFTEKLTFYDTIAGGQSSGTQSSGTSASSGSSVNPFDNNHDPFPGNAGDGVVAHTCSNTCTSVDRGCAWTTSGSCKCYAPPVSPFFWHSGNCGPVHTRSHSPKRDLAQHRRDYYLNATAQYALSDHVTAPLDPRPDLHAQLASGMLPSPCNASYVSFACSDSPDGIVHEPPQNWLGALLPESGTEFPPVPEEFLRIHGREEGKGQADVERRMG